MPHAETRSPSGPAEFPNVAGPSHLRGNVNLCFSTGVHDLREVCRDVAKDAKCDEWVHRGSFWPDSKQMSISVGCFTPGSFDQKIKLSATRISRKQ